MWEIGFGFFRGGVGAGAVKRLSTFFVLAAVFLQCLSSENPAVTEKGESCPREKCQGSEHTAMATKPVILLTGGGGYVASHCAVELLNEGFDVVAVDNYVNSVKGSGMPESLLRVQKLTGKNLTFYEADLCDKDSLRSVMKKHKVDCVMHLAALKAVGESCSLPLKYYTNNVMGSANLLEVMMEFDIHKIVFSSSATVYGDPHYLPLDEKHPVGNCTNPYGKTKFFMEEIIKDVCTANETWSSLLLRYFNPVGAHPSGEIGEDPQGIPNNLMPYISQVAVGRRDKLSVYGDGYDTVDGTGVRDYIHIMDIAEGHVAAIKYILARDNLGSKVFNLGTGGGHSVLEVVKAFEKASGKKIPYEIAPPREGDVASSYAACDLAEKELGWKAKLTLDDMCRDTWNWQSKNPQGFNTTRTSS